VIVRGVVKRLVRVVVAACPDLELDSIGIGAILHVEALVAIDLDITACKGPFLRVSANTISNYDGRAVPVVGLETLGGYSACLKENLALVGGGLGSGESSESDKDSERRHGEGRWVKERVRQRPVKDEGGTTDMKNARGVIYRVSRR
jgi:hypothetical protein